MSIFNPVWRVKIGGVQYQNLTLANLTITSGRTNIYEQANAGYVNLQLINLDEAPIDIEINDAVTIELQDSTATFVPIFGGTIVEFDIGIIASRVVGINQSVSILALGALSRLPKALTDGVLSHDFDGDQILTILTDLLINSWNEVPAALTWANYDPTEQWQNAQNTGLGEIDTPGSYELAQRSSSTIDVYSLVSALATSGLGYLYENPQGQISYASADHRSIYLAANGYTDLTASQALANSLSIQTRAGDIRNEINLKYGQNSQNSVTDNDATSIGLYGRLAQIISTTLRHNHDAEDQAAFYLTLRAYPQANFNQITFELTSPDIDDADRDALINIFMGLPLRISDLPLNMVSGTFLGFVEGWTWRASYNTVSVTAILSPLAFSLQAMQWQDVLITERWNTISGSLTWADALVVA
jgi:hypothetical protein